jgi:hypothetical protein
MIGPVTDEIRYSPAAMVRERIRACLVLEVFLGLVEIISKGLGQTLLLPKPLKSS